MILLLDRLVVAGLVVGLALYVCPFWREGRLLWAFWVTLGCTVLHLYTSHRRGSRAVGDHGVAKADGGPPR